MSEMERMQFFSALEQEISRAEMAGKSILIQMDANSKLGPNIIPGDPHQRSPNGRILAGIIDRHGLVVVIGLMDKCEDIVTRKRVTKDATEESVIDFVIISDDIESSVESLLIDEKQQHGLTKIVKTKKGVKITQSDHNVLITRLKIGWCKKVLNKRIELYNL